MIHQTSNLFYIR